jgi:hypothetical protein
VVGLIPVQLKNAILQDVAYEADRDPKNKVELERLGKVYRPSTTLRPFFFFLCRILELD